MSTGYFCLFGCSHSFGAAKRERGAEIAKDLSGNKSPRANKATEHIVNSDSNKQDVQQVMECFKRVNWNALQHVPPHEFKGTIEVVNICFRN